MREANKPKPRYKPERVGDPITSANSIYDLSMDKKAVFDSRRNIVIPAYFIYSRYPFRTIMYKINAKEFHFYNCPPTPPRKRRVINTSNFSSEAFSLDI